MKVLLLAPCRGGALTPASRRTLGAARKLGPVSLLPVGEGWQQAGAAARHLAGIAAVLLPEPTTGEALPPEELAALVTTLAHSFSHILAPDTTLGQEVMARAAAICDRGAISGVTAILAADTFQRPAHAGRAWVTLRAREWPLFLTVRQTAFPEETPDPSGEEAPIIALGPVPRLGLSRRLELTPRHQEGRPPLEAASVVVGGGGGFIAGGNLEPVEALANCLGGAVAVTRAVVEAGLAPGDWQVGQTGRVIAPRLYVALGISGSFQHLAGIKEAGRIAAINHDPGAPILSAADWGLVADMYRAIPELIALLQVAADQGEVREANSCQERANASSEVASPSACREKAASTTSVRDASSAADDSPRAIT
ncbi:MAG: electron transfer flavoprotein subunit alpha/FixB family protein [Magnetococcales bacterium]|nr:electron transfer flavoprotein subunit alpha/FixB family protein [Magnetococcales bacterium]